MRNPINHDFVVLVYVFVKLIKSEGIKQSGIENLHWLFKRMLKNKEYFAKNLSITESYHPTSKIINYFCNKYCK